MVEISPRRVENSVGKGEIARDEHFSFSRGVFKRLVLQIPKTRRACLGKVLNHTFPTCNDPEKENF